MNFHNEWPSFTRFSPPHFSRHNLVYGSKRGRNPEYEASVLCSRIKITASQSLLSRTKLLFYSRVKSSLILLNSDWEYLQWNWSPVVNPHSAYAPTAFVWKLSSHHNKTGGRDKNGGRARKGLEKFSSVMSLHTTYLLYCKYA